MVAKKRPFLFCILPILVARLCRGEESNLVCAEVQQNACLDPSNSNSVNIYSEVFGAESHCFYESVLGEGLCYRAACVDDDQQLVVNVGGEWRICEFDYQELQMPVLAGALQVTLICPPYGQVCQGVTNTPTVLVDQSLTSSQPTSHPGEPPSARPSPISSSFEPLDASSSASPSFEQPVQPMLGPSSSPSSSMPSPSPSTLSSAASERTRPRFSFVTLVFCVVAFMR